MKFAANQALVKFAKTAMFSDDLNSTMRQAENALIEEFSTPRKAQTVNRWSELIAKIEDAGEPAEDNTDYIELGPFSFKVHQEYYVTIPGCPKLNPIHNFNYQHRIPYGGSVIALIDELIKFYETTTYVERYQMVFGYTSATMNANAAISDFTNFYMPDFKCVGINKCEVD